MRSKSSLFVWKPDISRRGKTLSQEKFNGHVKERHDPAPEPSTCFTDEQLLEVYLGLPRKERDERFADTARAAEIVGLSQRTIQLWIEIGLIRAFFLGGKYKICLHSLKGYLKSRIEQQAI